MFEVIEEEMRVSDEPSMDEGPVEFYGRLKALGFKTGVVSFRRGGQP